MFSNKKFCIFHESYNRFFEFCVHDYIKCKHLKKTIERNINIDFIIYLQFNKQTKVKHDYLKRVFDYQLYQKQNTRKTCEKIEISWKNEKTIYKILDMTLKIQLKYWQFTNVKFLRDMRHNKLVKNCILTNYIKLNKT